LKLASKIEGFINMIILDENRLEKKMGAVVLASSYTALAVVRSLGRQGIPVWILDDKRSPTRFSRYVLRRFDLPVEEENQAKLLLSIAEDNNLLGWSLFPDGDKGASMIARHYEKLSTCYQLTTPPWETLQWAVDKKMTYQLAAEVGAAYPKAFYPESIDDIQSIDGQFPMIVKPVHHQGHDAFSNGRAWQVENHNELTLLYNEMSQVADPSVILAQEMIPSGPGTQFSYAALCKDGKVLADLFAERKRLTPARFGVSAYVESLEFLDIKNSAGKWLERIRYTGMVEIEYMLDKRDGVYKLLDVNTRPWGWIAMCVYAGVDFPYLMWKLSQNKLVEEAHGRGGVGWSRTVYDLAAMFELVWSGDRSISLINFIQSLLHAKHEMYVTDDLKPAFFEFSQLISRAFRKLSKILGFNQA